MSDPIAVTLLELTVAAVPPRERRASASRSSTSSVSQIPDDRVRADAWAD